MAEAAVDTVKLTIDEKPVSVPKGTLVIEAARQMGVMIPHFCYHPKLKPDANCRMCLVEVERMPKLQTACSTPVAEGMVVRTATTVVNDAHKSVLEFILANHPLDCPVCDQGGRCDLQDFSHQYTPTTSRFIEVKRVFPKEYFSPLIETQMNRCVQCLRCVRYCDEVMDVKALAPSGRGTLTEIKHFTHHELECEFCGGCVQICPVGAITSRLSMYEYRPWMLKRADTICTYCGDGCQLTLQTKGNELIEAMSAYGAGRNSGDLCARGFFGYHVSTHPARLQHPLIRRDGQLVEATWEEALELVADRLSRIKLAHGPQAIAGLITARCTNEELYLFQKFMRLAIGTNKLDSSARYGHVNAVRALRRVQGTHRWAVSFEDIVAADVLLLIGTNITETNPITGLKVKEAVKKHGAKLLSVESLVPAQGTISNISNLAMHHASVHPNHLSMAVLALIKALLEDQHVNQALTQRAPAYVKAIEQALGKISWAGLVDATGTGRETWIDMARILAGASRAVIVAGQGVLRMPGGSATTVNLLDLLLLTGHHNRPGCGLAPLAEENNDQGAVEMGAVTEYVPGPGDLDDRGVRERISGLWKDDLPQGPRLTLMEILEEAKAGVVKAMLVVGENPVASLPPSTGAEEALKRLDFLVCQEMFLTETAALADVVLPVCSYAEKDGTFTNTEGHVQQVRQAIDPIGESRPDWEVFSALSGLMSYPLEYGSAKEILKEIRSLIPGYAVLGAGPTPPRPDQAVVDRYLREGYAKDLDARYVPAGGAGAKEKEFTFLLAQSLFHSGKLSTYAKGLLKVQDSGSVALNPIDAERLEVVTGDRVRIFNLQGDMTTVAKVLDHVPQGLAVFPEHFDREAHKLMTMSTDAVTGTPYCKMARVSIERA